MIAVTNWLKFYNLNCDLNSSRKMSITVKKGGGGQTPPRPLAARLLVTDNFVSRRRYGLFTHILGIVF